MLDLSILREKSIKFIYDVFAKDCINDNNLVFEGYYFNKVVDNIFNDLIKNKNKNNNPTLIKLGGQSGSGKTTQLMPSISNSINIENYIHIAVRFFAKCHPYYDELFEKYGESDIREKTNGFALMCLFAVSEKLIKNKYNILFEVTLLDPCFEEYFARLSKSLNYKIIYNVLSVPLEVSNYWIKSRFLNDKYEKNRIVSTKSINYFYNILPEAISNILSINNIFDKNDFFILWNLTKKQPLIATNDFKIDILNIFNENRVFVEDIFDKILDKKDSLEYKINFYKIFFENKY